MAYKDVIQSPGRIITKRIYCQSGNTYTTLSNEYFYSAKIGTNYNLGDGTVCTYLELELDKELDLSHDGDFITINIYAHIQGGQEYGIGFNRFYPKELTNNYDANSKHYIYKLYDGMIKAMIPYVPVNITYPTTCQTYFNALISALGWTGNITLDVTGSKVFEEDIYDGMNFTYRDIISDILQANGIVGYMSGNTTIASKVLNTSSTPTDVINDDILKNVNVQLGKKFGPINSLTLSRSNDTDLITAKDDTSITNNGLTNIVIKDNYLLNDDDRSDYINALFNKYKGKQWYLYDCELTGYGGLNILSPITISTNGENYNSLIFNYEINLDEGYSEVIYNDIEEGYSNTKYMYTDSEVKADKNAEIIIDKKIGEVDIRGKIIKIQADETLGIESTNFNVDTDGNMTCNSATMNNGTINGGNLTVNDNGEVNNGKIIIQNTDNSGKATIYSKGFSVNDKSYYNDGVINNFGTYKDTVIASRGFSTLTFHNRDVGKTQLEGYDLDINAYGVSIYDRTGTNTEFMDITAKNMYFSDNQGGVIEITSSDITKNGKSIIQKSNISMGLGSNATISNTNETKINLSRVAYTGSGLTASSDGGVLVGAGISAVMVSAQAYISAFSGNALRTLFIKKYRNGTLSNIARSSLRLNTTYTGTYNTIQITSRITGVQEGDIIYLYAQHQNPSSGTSSTTIYGSGIDTYLTVQELE